MDSATQNYLRQAATSALADKDDASALEIIKLMQGLQGPQPQKQGELALLPPEASNAGPAHTGHYWAQLTREAFIPFIIQNGRARFTSTEVFTWLENYCADKFTSGDLALRQDGSMTWKGIASDGLCNLKRQGVIESEPHGRTYQITKRLMPRFSIPIDDPDRLDQIAQDMPRLP